MMHRSAGPAIAARASPRWCPLCAAGAMVATVLYCLGSSWQATWNSHPLYWLSLLVAGVGAVVVASWAWRSAPDPARSRVRKWLLRASLVVATVGLAAALVYLRPLGADAAAIDALADGGGVNVKATTLVVRMQPDDPKHTGLVFYPGAKIDPRAYAAILRPIAEAGYPVVIIKLPFELAVLTPFAADAVVGDDDDIDRWVVAGHSLGGAMAATYAAGQHDELAGLLLYGAYPADSLADRRGLDVVSVYGTEDGLATVAEIERSTADLPPDASFVAVEGGIHAFFGDYGPQVGDGTATISRHDAQRQIVNATLDLMEKVDSER